MENIYAALLLHKAGKDVNEENLKKVVAAAGVESDDSKIKSLVASLKDVDIEKELENASLVTSAAPAEGKKEGSDEGKEEKEEKKEEKSEAAAEGLSALFG